MSSSSNSLSSNPAILPLGDVVCRVDVLLGTATVSVRDCLRWKRNSVIRLQQSAGADMQIEINSIPVATAEVVIVDDSIAVRVTEILAPPSSEAHS